MKIIARVTFSKYANREFIIQAFFDKKEFSPNNKLWILDDETAFIQLEFDSTPPQSIIKAISHCKINIMSNMESRSIEELIEEYNAAHTFGTLAKLNDDESGDETLAEEPDETPAEEPDETLAEEPDETPAEELDETPAEELDETLAEEPDETLAEEPDETPAEESNETPAEEPDETPAEEPDETPAEEPDETLAEELEEPPTGKPTKPVKKRRCGKMVPSEDDYLDIPAISDMVAKAASFADLVTEVSKWLNLSDEYADGFVQLVTELSKLDQKGYEYTSMQVTEANRKVGHRDFWKTKLVRTVPVLLEEQGVYSTFHPFLCTILKYKDDFSGQAEESSGGDSQSDDDHAHECDTVNAEDVAPVDVTAETDKTEELNYMACKNFVGIYESIDKDLSLNDKVKVLLSEMGLDKKSKLLYQSACQIVMAAFSMETIESIDDVMQNAGLDTKTKNGMQTKIKFSEWINDYNKANHIKRMKIIAFLREIKAIFTLE